MSHRLISKAVRTSALIGTAGVVSAAALFASAPGALAAPAAPRTFSVTLSCSTISGLSDNLASYSATWIWYQGGINGTEISRQSLNSGLCPPAGDGAITATATGAQPTNADTLFVFVEGGMGGCGSLTSGTTSFAPGAPATINVNMTNTSPCSYQKNLPKAVVTSSFAGQS